MGVRPKFLVRSRNRRLLAAGAKPSKTPKSRTQDILTKASTLHTIIFTKILTSLGLIVFTAFLAFTIESHWGSITIKPFEVSKWIEDNGFTGHIISDLLLEDIRVIQDVARRRVRSGSFGQVKPEDSPLLDEALPQQVMLPGTGVSVETVAQAILGFLGHAPTKISGSLLHAGQSTVLMLRIGHRTEVIRSPPGRPCAADCIDALLQEAAERVYLDLDSFALAVYYFDRDSARCETLIRYCLRNNNLTDDAAAYNLWGLLLKSQGKVSEAEKRFIRALERSRASTPNPRLAAVIYSNWGTLFDDQHRFALARDKYERALKEDGTYIDALYNSAVAWKGDNRPDKAEAIYREVIRRNPNHLYAFDNLADILLQKGKIDEALRIYAETERIAKYRNPEVYVNWARALLQEKRYGEAVEKCDRALDLDPKNLEASQMKANPLLFGGKPAI